MPRKNGRRHGSRFSRVSFTDVHTSPWRPVHLFMRATTTAEKVWENVTNLVVQKVLYEHLGFKASTDRYLEMRYQSLSVKLMASGSPIALRLYSVEGETTPEKDHENCESSAESYPLSSMDYPTVQLKWSAKSYMTPVTAAEDRVVFRVASDKKDARMVIQLQALYRHAETPFNSSAKAVFHTIPLAVDVDVSLAFEVLNA